MKRSILAAALIGAVSFTSRTLHAEQTTQPSIEQRLSIIERKYEIDKEEAAIKAKETPLVVSSKEGFQIKSPDGGFILRFNAVLQTDYRDYRGDQGTITDQFLIRRARTIFEGVINKVFAFRVMPDFANGGGTTAGPNSSLLQDAYLEWQKVKAAKVRVGKFKSPVGLEHLQSDTNGPFVEKTFTTQLVPNRDTGFGLNGDIKDGLITYQAAIVNGVADASSGETDINDGKDYVGRIFVQPFKQSNSDWINGLGLGIGGSIGNVTGTTTVTGLPLAYRTDGQQAFFAYSLGTFANGTRTRLAPQAYWYTSRTSLLWEYVASAQEISNASVPNPVTITHRAWQTAGSIVLTGERPSYNGVKPKYKTWGALELVGRYSVFRADDEVFSQSFANPAVSARKAKAWATGLNWYVSNNVRFSSDYAVTSFLGGAANGNRLSEKVFLNRVQLVY